MTRTFTRLLFWPVLISISLYAQPSGVFYRDDVKDVVLDKQRKLMWQDDSSASTVEETYVNAKKYCEDLAFAGYTNWYLPNINELKSIVKADNYPRSIVKAFKNVAPNYYWSSSEYTSEYAWIVLFIYEDVVYYHKNDSSYVRCVRKAE